jgi:hypothetical protein
MEDSNYIAKVWEHGARLYVVDYDPLALRTNKWIAMKPEDTTFRTGYFTTLIEAAKAYCEKYKLLQE